MFTSWPLRNGGRRGSISGVKILCLTAVIAVLVAGFVWAQKEDQQTDYRSDLISISSMLAFGELELPPVRFDHAVHTKTLDGQDKGCATCHPRINGQFVFTFSGLKAASKKDAQNVYHEQCVSCHREQITLGRSSGPLEGECRVCHQKGTQDTDLYAGAGMDLALHATHIEYIESLEGTCGDCHHTYNAQSQELIHTPGEELGCRACHLKERRIALSSLFQAPEESLFTPQVSAEYLDSDKPPSWSQAAHLSCVNCHVQTRESSLQELEPPVSCQGCHGPKRSLDPDSQHTAPRLKRGQPDAVFIGPSPADLQTVHSGTLDHSLMPLVPFDHKTHEESVDTCRACHHQSRLEPCAKCHDLQGSEKGAMITLEQAMHSQDSALSCLGCHRQNTLNRQECAGCHVFQNTKSWAGSAENCRICHHPNSPQHQELLGLSQEQRSLKAQDLFLARGEEPEPALPNLPKQLTIRLDSEDFGSLSLPVRLAGEEVTRFLEQLRKKPAPETVQSMIQDMPQEVTIDAISDQYGPVVLPHAQIAASLEQGISSDALAQAFHTSEFTLCQGCHHQSPPSKNPPSCASCHAQPFAAKNSGRLGLKAAYHTMCMDCHDQMKIKEPANTDCAACHAQQKTRIISDIK